MWDCQLLSIGITSDPGYCCSVQAGMGSPTPGLLPGPPGEVGVGNSTKEDRTNAENQKKNKTKNLPKPTTTQGDLINPNPLS